MFSKLSLIQKFIIALVASLTLVGFAFGKIVSSLLEENITSRATEVTSSVLKHEVKEMFHLDKLTTPLKGTEYDKVADIVNTYPLTHNTVRVKIWNKDSIVVWSENREMVGQQFLNNDELEQSLRAHVVFEREKDYVVLDGKVDPC